MKNLTTMKATILGIMAGVMVTVPLVAGPQIQQVTATWTTRVGYVLDQEPILTDSPTLQYKGRNYVSVADIARAFGKEVNYVNGKVVITTPIANEEENTMQEGITIARATIKEVEEGRIAILPAGLEDRIENYIILVMNKDTVIEGINGEQKAPADLEQGMVICAVHSMIMQPSLPPQTGALKIQILEEQVDLVEQGVIIEKATIQAIEGEGKRLVILPDGRQDDQMNYIVLNVQEDTVIKTAAGKTLKVVDLKEGDTVRVVHSLAMTRSIPPQTSAMEITRLDK